MHFSLITLHHDLADRAAHDFLRFALDRQHQPANLSDGAGLKDCDSSLYADHQLIWRFFSDQNGQPRSFLFRRMGEGQGTRFYLLSPTPPKRPEGFSDAWQIQTRPYDPHPHQGARYRFELRANPVVSRKDPQGRRLRHDVVMNAKCRLLAQHGYSHWNAWPHDDPAKPNLYQLVHDTCADWLAQRAEQHGFALDRDTLQTDAYQQHSLKRHPPRPKDPARRPAQHQGTRTPGYRSGSDLTTIDYCGTLTVTDPGRFRDLLLKGLGHAKAFGCGLMLIKPL